MKKKIIGMLSAGIAVFTLSGCGGGGDDYYDPGPLPVTLFLLDEQGFSYAGVPYICDGMANWDYTLSNGEFTFYEFESCTFDFLGYAGNYSNDPSVDDIIRITDDLNFGIEGIAYDCDVYGPGSTRIDGDFDYDFDDQCTFHFQGVY